MRFAVPFRVQGETLAICGLVFESTDEFSHISRRGSLEPSPRTSRTQCCGRVGVTSDLTKGIGTMSDDVVNFFADEFEHPPGETLVRSLSPQWAPSLVPRVTIDC